MFPGVEWPVQEVQIPRLRLVISTERCYHRRMRLPN